MSSAMSDQQSYQLAVADWRRQVHRLYRAVRAEAAEAAASAPASAHRLWVDGRTELFDRHPASPRRPGQQMRHADYDPAFRFVLPVVPASPERLEIPTGTDGVVAFERIGRFELPLADDQPDPTGDGHAGELARLDVWWLASYGGGVFVPLRDGTAGTETYGAGRYLLDTVKGADLGRTAESADAADSHWVIDLNFAYNPSCVYDSRWACPLAPAGNRFTARAAVGELLPTGY